MSKYIFSSVFLLVCNLAIAQGWDRVFPSVGGEEAKAVTRTQDDGFLLAGSYIYGQQVYVVKTDADGMRQWARTYNTGVFGIANAVRQDQDGSLILGGEMDTLVGVFKRRNFFLRRINPYGQTLWYRNYGTASKEVGTDFVVLPSGDIVMCGYREEADGNESVLLLRVTPQGVPVWFKTVGASANKKKALSMTLAPNGDLVLCGELKPTLVSHVDALVMRVSSDGDLVWEKAYNLNNASGMPGDELARKIVSANNGTHFVIAGRTTVSMPGLGGFVLAITSDANNTPIWSTVIPETDLYGMTADLSGGYYVAGAREVSATLGDLVLVRLDAQGQVLWDKITGRAGPDQANAVIVDKYGGAVAVGYSEPFVLPTGEQFFYMVRADADGRVFTSKVKGRIFFDANQNCASDPNEPGLRHWIVRVSNASQTFTYYAVSNGQGQYSMDLDTGAHTMTLLNANNNWAPCTPSITFTIPAFFDSTTVDVPIRSLTPCPYNEVDVATPFLRRCADNVYTVNYCNSGDVVSTNTQVTVTLDPALSFQASSLPPSQQLGNVLVFNLGNLAPGQCGRFTVTAFLDCDSRLGQAHCVKAQITPDDFCQPGVWNGAYVEARGECENGQVRMFLRNKGTQTTSDVVEFVIADDVVMLVPPSASFIALDPGQEIQAWAGSSGSGSTIRIIAVQEPTFPGISTPTAAVEGCVTQPGDDFSTGFFTMFPEDDQLPSIEYDCQETNDTDFNPTHFKRGHPKGYDDQHYVDARTELEYLIYFRNLSGQNVSEAIVRDTLPSALDPGSVIPGSGSHDFEFQVYGAGIVEFVFPDINLAPGAGAWANFRVKPFPNEVCGPAVSINTAAIYLDYETPLITNEVLHTICDFDSFVVVSTLGPAYEGASLLVYPNPVTDYVMFELAGLSDVQAASMHLQCFDTWGRMVWQSRFDQPTLRVGRHQLPSGMLFYRLMSADGRMLASGKLLVAP